MRASFAFSGALFLALAGCGESLDVDRCLDAGGSFDYVAGQCDFEKSHPGPTKGKAARPSHLTGRFSAVSESEWTLDLTLSADGSAVIDRSWWGGADDYSKTTKDQITGTWRAVDEIVTVRHGDSEERLCYSAELSRAELGETGAPPPLAPDGT